MCKLLLISYVTPNPVSRGLIWGENVLFLSCSFFVRYAVEGVLLQRNF